MPPKQRITREMILTSAFAMFVREGMDVVNARSVAKALGCSTQPIFSYFTGMQELKDALDQKSKELFAEEVLSNREGGNPLVELYTAYARFACARPHVFEHLFASAHADRSRMAEFVDLQRSLIDDMQRLENLSDEKAARLVNEVGVYAVGLTASALLTSKGCAGAKDRIAEAYATILARLA